MVVHIFVILHQRRIFGKLARDVRVASEELSKLAAAVRIAVHAVVVTVVAGFLLHEGVRILADVLTHFRMLLQVSLQGRMILHKFIVIDL